jgi:hypothetical protein
MSTSKINGEQNYIFFTDGYLPGKKDGKYQFLHNKFGEIPSAKGSREKVNPSRIRCEFTRFGEDESNRYCAAPC